MQFLPRKIDMINVVAVYEKNDSFQIFIVMSPECPYSIQYKCGCEYKRYYLRDETSSESLSVLPSHVPNCKIDIIVLNIFNIKTNCWDRFQYFLGATQSV